MKKVFIILGILIISHNSVFAIDDSNLKQKNINSYTPDSKTTNYKQQKAEKKFLSDSNRLFIHYKIIQQDKETYNNNITNESFYGDLLNIIEKNKNLYNINTEYAQKTKFLFDEIVNCEDENIPIPEEFEKKKIIIRDNDFDKIDKDLKNIIFLLNVY